MNTMSQPVTVQIGSRSLGGTHDSGRGLEPAGLSLKPAGRRSRILTLVGSQAPQRVDAVFAVVDGEAQDVERVYKALEAAFTPSNRTNLLPVGMEEDYVSTLLTTLATGTISIAIAVWVDWDLIAGCAGESQVYISKPRTFLNLETLPPQPGTGGRVRITRFTPSHGDSIALTTSSVAERVEAHEIRSAVRQNFSEKFTPQEAAEWLASLALPAGGPVSALVVQFSGLASLATPQSAFASSDALPDSLLRHRIHCGLVAMALAGAAIVAAFFVFQRSPGTPTSNRGGAVQPVALRTSGPPLGTRSAPPTSTASSVSKPVSVRTIPARVTGPLLQSWKFPALAKAPQGKVLLALYNPRKSSTVTLVRIIGRAGVEIRRVYLVGGGTVKLVLPAKEVRDARGQITTLYVQDQSAVIPMRVVVGNVATSPI